MFRLGPGCDDEEVNVVMPKHASLPRPKHAPPSRPKHVPFPRKDSKQPTISRRVTFPRRHRSCSDDDRQVYYINDGFDVTDDLDESARGEARSARSMSHIEAPADGTNIVVNKPYLFGFVELHNNTVLVIIIKSNEKSEWNDDKCSLGELT